MFIYVIDHFGDLTWMDRPEDRLYLGRSRDWGRGPIHSFIPQLLKASLYQRSQGLRQIWVQPAVADKLTAMRGPGESLQRGHPAAGRIGGPVVRLLIAIAIFCTASFQGYRVCDDDHGYRSTEWQWQGRTIGQDNAGNRWTTSRWRDIETTTITPR